MRMLTALLVSFIAVSCANGWSVDEGRNPSITNLGSGGGSDNFNHTGGHDSVPQNPTCTPGSTHPCYTGPTNTLGVGICKAGIHTCSEDGTQWGPCEGEIPPATELCANPDDEDCDGSTNEDCSCAPGAVEPCYSGPPGTDGAGICQAGTRTCSDNGFAWGPCEGEIIPIAELCSTPQDDDCDGTANEECVCAPGQLSPCYTGPAGTEGIGICKAGMSACAPDGKSWLPCSGEVTPNPTELCATAEDDDCDGALDNDNTGCPEHTTCQGNQCISNCLAHGITNCSSGICMLKFVCGSQGGPLICVTQWTCIP